MIVISAGKEYHLSDPNLSKFKHLSDYIYEDTDWKKRQFEIIYEDEGDWIFQDKRKTVIGFLEGIGHIKEWNTLIKLNI